MRLWTRIKMAVAAFFTILFKGRLPAALQPEARVELPVRPATDDAADRAIQLLALLQREGRLVDFLREDLGSYSDAQIGAAARDVHAGAVCRARGDSRRTRGRGDHRWTESADRSRVAAPRRPCRRPAAVSRHAPASRVARDARRSSSARRVWSRDRRAGRDRTRVSHHTVSFAGEHS